MRHARKDWIGQQSGDVMKKSKMRCLLTYKMKSKASSLLLYVVCPYGALFMQMSQFQSLL